MNLRKRTCPSCGNPKDEAEYRDYISGSRPCRACERKRVILARWRRIPLIKLRQEVEGDEQRLEAKKSVLAERMKNTP